MPIFSTSLAVKNEWVDTDDRLSYNLMKDENFKVHDSKLFRFSSGLHVRHGKDIHLALQLQDHCKKSFKFQLAKDTDTVIFTWTETPQVKYDEYHFYLHVNHSIPVGQYRLNIHDPCTEERTIDLCNVNVMFNPRLTLPDTLDDERVRRQTANAFTDEYLNNNNGYIWTGGAAISWCYAVGSQAVTDSKNRLIELMTAAERSNQVEYSRALTRLIGNNVLRGRWDGYYRDGVEPTQWVGSEEIYRRWLRFGQPVRYGQCWVFAGLLTTMLRASGIPARTVTNYNSHHDRGLLGNRRIRSYDNIIQSDESQWNFHVWSEAWLERPDLREPVNWNAIDATPQEPSPLGYNQPYRAGPAYVPYIRADRRTANYDTYFILAEVNARGICPITGRLLTTNVGYAVVTKSPGRNQAVYNFNTYNLITQSYKIPLVSKQAVNASDDDDNPELPPPYRGCERDGGMRVNITPSSPMVGEDFTIVVTEGNVSVEDTVIRMELRNYMGESLGFVRNFTGIRRLVVTEADYLPYLGETRILRFSVGVYNDTGHFVFHDDMRITLEYNDLRVEASGVDSSGTITLTLTYTNPLSIPMIGVMVNVAGPNNDYEMMEQPDIPANGRFTTTVTVQCGDNDDSDVMIPVSLDSNVTQSVHGTGWSSCGQGNSGAITLSDLRLMLFCLLALCLCCI